MAETVTPAFDSIGIDSNTQTNHNVFSGQYAAADAAGTNVVPHYITIKERYYESMVGVPGHEHERFCFQIKVLLMGLLFTSILCIYVPAIFIVAINSKCSCP